MQLSQHPGARLLLPLLPSPKSKNANGLSIVTVGFEILKCDVRSSGRSIWERLPAPKILLLNVHSVAMRTNNHLEG
ncbi:hypothetical protein T12_3398 [Trichinella patagoniensis]|uniref:Uncharacterized protein n=1 Tax=Trichinella patagoniensis TaxID=990121 RepID=A0A0V0Z4K9_9BILA|nr:hypothetical protein T12_3398 [Trichinella patagoniensis]